MGVERLIERRAELQRVTVELARMRVERDREITELFAAGASIAELAEATGLSPARIGQILGHPFHRPGRPTGS